MNLYSVHCGFYDDEISEGIYEFHVNIHVAAGTTEDAKAQVRLNPTFKKKKMHIDGIQEIKSVSGFKIVLQENGNCSDVDIRSIPYRDL